MRLPLIVFASPSLKKFNTVYLRAGRWIVEDESVVDSNYLIEVVGDYIPLVNKPIGSIEFEVLTGQEFYIEQSKKARIRILDVGTEKNISVYLRYLGAA